MCSKTHEIFNGENMKRINTLVFCSIFLLVTSITTADADALAADFTFQPRLDVGVLYYEFDEEDQRAHLNRNLRF